MVPKGGLPWYLTTFVSEVLALSLNYFIENNLMIAFSDSLWAQPKLTVLPRPGFKPGTARLKFRTLPLYSAVPAHRSLKIDCIGAKKSPKRKKHIFILVSEAEPTSFSIEICIQSNEPKKGTGIDRLS